MIQLVIPVVIKTAAPFVIKGAVVAGATLAVGITARYARNRAFKAGVDSVSPEPLVKPTYAQKVKSQMRLFVRSAWGVIKEHAVPTLLTCIAVAYAPVSAVVTIVLGAAAVAWYLALMVEEMFDRPIARGIRAAIGAIKRTAHRITARISKAWAALRSTEEWIDVEEETTEKVERAAKRFSRKHSVPVPAEAADPMPDVDAGINANFDHEADRDEAIFQSRLSTLIGQLNEDDFRTNLPQAVRDFFGELPETVFEQETGYKHFSAWVNKSTLSARQKSTAKRAFRDLQTKAA